MMHEGNINLLDALLGEHAVLYRLFNELEQRLDAGIGLAGVQAAIAPVSAALLSHAQIEDEMLFPALEERIGPEGPLAVMRAEHHEIDGLLARIGRSGDPGSAVADLVAAIELARDHFLKEERVLFAMARQAIGDAELCRLGGQWAELRGVTL